MATNYTQKQIAQPGSDIHSQEHERWNRRSFLQALGLVGGGSFMLGKTNVLAATNNELNQAINDAETENILIIVRLKGGNDGLNTIVPIYDYDRYANLRPTLKHAESSLYKLSDGLGLPPAMKDLQSFWGEGAMKIVHGVGYENQDLSHFKSSNIWASSDITDTENSGYLGRYFEEKYPDYIVNPPEIPPAIQIGSIGNLLFDGRGVSHYAVTVANPDKLEEIGENGVLHGLDDLPNCTYGERLKYLRSTTNNTFNYAVSISEAYKKANNAVNYGKRKLGKRLKEVARIIKGGLGTKVYMVSIGGFDTHANQAEKHDELWRDISESLKLFYEDLKATGYDKNVLAMTISEFGRRAEENGSKGTDHGQAAPMMLFGPAIQSNGFVGTHPNLNDLDRIGNLKYTFDFREVYAAAMKEWLCVDPATVDRALGTAFEPRDFGFSCKGIRDFSSILPFKHFLSQQENQTLLHFVKQDTSHVNISLYDLVGGKVAELKNEMMPPGSYSINISETVGYSFNSGIYIYRILAGEGKYSAKAYIR